MRQGSLTISRPQKTLAGCWQRASNRTTFCFCQGPLGAGKTSLVQGLAGALGIQEPITSPTFALAQHYPEGTPPLIHLDLYRLEQAIAADDLFLQEEEEANAMGALLVVEWPERLSLSLPDAWRLGSSVPRKLPAALRPRSSHPS